MKRGFFLIAVLLLAYLATGLYQVQYGERAVVRRFGRVLPALQPPGLHFGLPWGMDRVDRIAIDEQRQITVGFQDLELSNFETAPAGQVLTGDNNLLDLRMTVYYRVNSSPEHVVDYALNDERIESFLTRAAELALVSTVAGQRVDEILLSQAKNIEPLLQQELANALRDYPLGVLIETINLTYAQPPAELAEVFREVNRARTQREIAQSNALGEKQTLLSSARTDARRTSTDGEVAANRQVSQAKAEATNFLELWHKFSRYTSDPNNALLNLYLTEMQTILSRMQVRTLSGPNVDQTIFFPLPEK